jgi:hypothetical protein
MSVTYVYMNYIHMGLKIYYIRPQNQEKFLKSQTSKPYNTCTAVGIHVILIHSNSKKKYTYTIQYKNYQYVVFFIFRPGTAVLHVLVVKFTFT